MALPIYDNIPELSTQANAVARRRKIAEAMMAQGQEQLPTNQMAGQVVAPVSFTQGLAKLANAYLGRKTAEDADKAEQGLANQRQQMVADKLMQIRAVQQGQAGVEGVEAQPERTIQAPAPMQEGQIAPNYNTVPETVPAVEGRKAVPAIAPNPRQAMEMALMDNNPEIKRLADSLQYFDTQDATAKERKDAREENAQNALLLAKEKMADSRATALEKQQAQQEFLMMMQKNNFSQQESMARLGAALRPSSASSTKPTMIMGADGNPIYVNAEDAIGKRPYSAAQSAKDTAKAQQNSQAEISAQQVLDQAEILFNHKGRELGTGTSSFVGNVPFIASDAKDFQKNLDTFKAQTFVPMVSALKGMGALSDAEGKKLSDSVGALDPNMTEEAFAISLKAVTNTLFEKAKAAGLNVSLPDFSVDKTKKAGTVKPAVGVVEYVRDSNGKLRPK
jgi:hypothetical protein